MCLVRLWPRTIADPLIELTMVTPRPDSQPPQPPQPPSEGSNGGEDSEIIGDPSLFHQAEAPGTGDWLAGVWVWPRGLPPWVSSGVPVSRWPSRGHTRNCRSRCSPHARVRRGKRAAR
jgi:hypothetical protein